jgi:transposase-like protein
MAKAALSDPIFNDEQKAREWLEKRLWPDGPICPKCGVVDEATLLKGETTRPGLYQCNACRKPFSVTVGTLYERSKIPLNKWLAATYLLQSSKKGISALQIHRTLGVSKKTAWFLMHRIRESLRELPGAAPMGSGGGGVEADETFFGQNPDAAPNKRATATMNAVMTLVDRTTGRARSVIIEDLKAETIWNVLRENLAAEARLMTDEAQHYKRPGMSFASHDSVNHSKDEYVSRENPEVHTNTVENYYSVFKRGMRGTYQHCGKAHLHRYCAEFDFRYSNRLALGVDDHERFERSIPGIVGKRLTYRRTRRVKEETFDIPF